MAKRGVFLNQHTSQSNNHSLLQWNCWTTILSLSRFGAMTEDWLELITCFESAIQVDKERYLSNHNEHDNRDQLLNRNRDRGGENIKEWKGYWLCDDDNWYPFTLAQQQHVLDNQTLEEKNTPPPISSYHSNPNNINHMDCVNLSASDQCWITIETILLHCEGIVYKKAAMNLLFFITKHDQLQSSLCTIVAGLCLAFCNGKDDLSFKLSKSLVKDLVKRGVEPSLPCILVCLIVCMNERVNEGKQE